MFARKLLICTLAAAWLPTGQRLQGETVEGSIVIKRTLTKRRVTAAPPLYQRGASVAFTADKPEDPLDFERERVVVYLEGRRPAPPQMVRLAQERRRFSSDTVVIAAGSKVSFPNNDPIFHNVFSLSKTKSFDLGNYPQGETRVVTFNEPGVVIVNCQLHSNMAAVIFVTPNQWYTKADREGRFTLQDVPPGKYTLVAWHKSAGYFRREIELQSGHGASVDILIPWTEAVSLTGTPGSSKARTGARPAPPNFTGASPDVQRGSKASVVRASSSEAQRALSAPPYSEGTLQSGGADATRFARSSEARPGK